MDVLENYLKPKTCGANISPFSSKNLPKNKSYTIPDADLMQYKAIIKNIDQTRILEISHITNSFLKNITEHNSTWKDIKSDMTAKGLHGKKYIHSLGIWNEYIKYLTKELE